MITRNHQSETASSSAIYSDCESYRYALTRTWDEAAPRLNFVMLNPSTASELKNDPTVERCERRARTLGYGAFRVTNIFAWRATDPKDLRAAAEPNGPDNDAALRDGARWADHVIAAWGAHGTHLGRGAQVLALLRASRAEIYHLGMTLGGLPRHPLYVAYAQRPQPWPQG